MTLEERNVFCLHRLAHCPMKTSGLALCSPEILQNLQKINKIRRAVGNLSG